MSSFVPLLIDGAANVRPHDRSAARKCRRHLPCDHGTASQ